VVEDRVAVTPGARFKGGGAAVSRVTRSRQVVHVAGADRVARPDTLVVEEPLEIRLDGRPLAVTMRTPGHDFDLVAGFLVGEGVIGHPSELTTMRYCAGVDEDGTNTFNVIDVTLDAEVSVPELSLERNFYTTSSCGLCGKASVDAIRLRSRWDPHADHGEIAVETLYALPDTLRRAQRVFARTGGLHAAGLFSMAGELRCLREDVGRHNAVDKVLGHALRSALLPLRGHVLLVSGRASFELTQKALLAGIPALAAVSAPSSLAVELAAESGMTLVGFLRERTMNVYTGAERVVG
jgi:FdhD protein